VIYAVNAFSSFAFKNIGGASFRPKVLPWKWSVKELGRILKYLAIVFTLPLASTTAIVDFRVWSLQFPVFSLCWGPRIGPLGITAGFVTAALFMAS
jgi:hypothetical protein